MSKKPGEIAVVGDLAHMPTVPIKRVLQKCPQTSLIFVSASISEELAVQTVRAGAADHVLKDSSVFSQLIWKFALGLYFERNH